jgi:hypothetical protein
MNDGWIRPAAPEEFGDSLVAGGALGLIAGTALHMAGIGVVLGLIVGALVDSLVVLRKARVRA